MRVSRGGVGVTDNCAARLIMSGFKRHAGVNSLNKATPCTGQKYFNLYSFIILISSSRAPANLEEGNKLFKGINNE